MSVSPTKLRLHDVRNHMVFIFSPFLHLSIVIAYRFEVTSDSQQLTFSCFQVIIT